MRCIGWTYYVGEFMTYEFLFQVFGSGLIIGIGISFFPYVFNKLIRIVFDVMKGG